VNGGGVGTDVGEAMELALELAKKRRGRGVYRLDLGYCKKKL